MRKKIIMLGLAITCGLALSACFPEKQPVGQGQPAGEKSDKPISFDNLKSLIDSNLALRCTWNFEENGISASGELYGQGKKFHQTAVYQEGGDEVNVTSISDGEWMYMWSDGPVSMGSKIEMEKLDELNAKTASEGTGEKMVNLEKDINLVCYPWTVDESKFQAPEGIEFMDLTPMIMQANEMMQDGSMCSSCNYIPAGPEREDCLDSFNCR